VTDVTSVADAGYSTHDPGSYHALHRAATVGIPRNVGNQSRAAGGAQASGQATLVAVIEPRTPLTNEGESSVDRSETRAIASDTAMASGTSA